MITQLNYFGTNTKQSGHYFWTLGEGFYSGGSIRDINWNPEGLIKGLPNGEMNVVTINGLNIIAIAGSPFDKRGGCCSVFWSEKGVRFIELKEAILRLPASKKIIEAMPFEVKWKINTPDTAKQHT